MDPQKRIARRERKRDELIHKAIEMAAQDGLDSLTTTALAAEMGVTAGALYRYFKSKDHLLAAVEIAVIESFAQAIDAAELAIETDTELKRVLVAVEAYRLLETERPGEFRVLAYFIGVPDAVLPDDVAADVAPAALRLFSHYGAVVSDAMEAGELDAADALQRAMVLWSAAHGVLERRKITRILPGDMGLDIAAIYRATVNALLQAWGADQNELKNTWDWIESQSPTIAAAVGETE